MGTAVDKTNELTEPFTVFSAYSALTNALTDADYDPDSFLIMLDNGWHTADIWYDFRLDMNPEYVCSVYLYAGTDGKLSEVRLRNSDNVDFYVNYNTNGGDSGLIVNMMDAIRAEKERIEEESPTRDLVVESIGYIIGSIRNRLTGPVAPNTSKKRHKQRGRHATVNQ